MSDGTWPQGVLVTFLLLRRDTVTEGNYLKHPLIGGLLTVSEVESMSIMAESMTAGRSGTGAVAKSLPLIHKFVAKRG